jgi:positive regulator of sigma E activity
MNTNKATKMRKGTGTFINRRTKTGKKTYDRFFFYVPTEVARDGTFPFSEGDKVEIEIKEKSVVITKAKD